ncbi:MAG: radical SAM protein [Spirochaetes bacterium]|nr:radical SAM protein [Spirochaetota bacterium]
MPKGILPFETFSALLEQAKDSLLIAVLYVGGEPLLYKDIYRAAALCTRHRVPTMIATNGMLLTEKASSQLLDAGLDFIKIAVSGFTQGVYQRQHRKGKIERIKGYLDILSKLIRQRKSGLVVMVDYISYAYNAHELPLMRAFCQERGFLFNVRPGITTGMGAEEPEKPLFTTRVTSRCTWPWEAVTVNWNGDLFPCCDYTSWVGSKPYLRYRVGGPELSALWNGAEVRKYRLGHLKLGRQCSPVCLPCTREGLLFKY